MSAYGTPEQLQEHFVKVGMINALLAGIEKAYKEIAQLSAETGLMVSYYGPGGKGDSGTLYPPGTFDHANHWAWGGPQKEPEYNAEPLWMPSSQEGC